MTQYPEKSSRRWHRYTPRSGLFYGPVSSVALVNVAILIGLFMTLDFAFVLKPGVVVELPEADFVSGSYYGAMMVTLTQEGKVFFNDEWMPMEELEFAFKQAAHRMEHASLIIEADARVDYGVVVEVINMATAARIRQVDLATRPLFTGSHTHDYGAERK